MSEETIFDNKQDFINYYNKNALTLQDVKTKELNQKFKVKGFKIIRNKGKIAFRSIEKEPKEPKEQKTQGETKEVETKEVEPKTQEEQYNTIRETLIKDDIETSLNKTCDDLHDVNEQLNKVYEQFKIMIDKLKND